MKKAPPYRKILCILIAVCLVSIFIHRLVKNASEETILPKILPSICKERAKTQTSYPKTVLLDGDELDATDEVEISKNQMRIYSRVRPLPGQTPAKPFAIVLTVAHNSESWGIDRNFSSYLQMISQFDYPHEFTSLGLLLSDESEYEHVKAIFQASSFTYHSVKVIYLPEQPIVSRAGRKEDSVQRERRRMLAKIRNYLLQSALRDIHDAVLWVDADIIEIPANLLSRMISSNRDIIVPLCVTKHDDGDREYDTNTWKGKRLKPTASQREAMAHGDISFVPRHTHLTHFLGQMHTQEEFVEIDSVGGTVLFVKADIHREGVIFPTQYIVGGEWEYEGYDAIETEGICYLAERLCYKCWGMPHSVVVHTPQS